MPMRGAERWREDRVNDMACKRSRRFGYDRHQFFRISYNLLCLLFRKNVLTIVPGEKRFFGEESLVQCGLEYPKGLQPQQINRIHFKPTFALEMPNLKVKRAKKAVD